MLNSAKISNPKILQPQSSGGCSSIWGWLKGPMWFSIGMVYHHQTRMKIPIHQGSIPDFETKPQYISVSIFISPIYTAICWFNPHFLLLPWPFLLFFPVPSGHGVTSLRCGFREPCAGCEPQNDLGQLGIQHACGHTTRATRYIIWAIWYGSRKGDLISVMARNGLKWAYFQGG